MQKTKNPLIFIIEDSTVYKDLIVGYLQSQKFTNLKVYKNGDECLRNIHRKPDLIILDYSTEGKTGLELMVQIQKEYPDTNFIFLSGQNNLEVAVKIMKIGAADYIVKNDQAPYNLVKSIEQIINNTKREKASKGFKVGVIGFFVMLFLIIMIIMFMSIFFDLEL
ncbi:response regulator [Prolixibacteraceae bacterium Z1-6]|uniref:Response regulator n=1 Tax=Draconibacterium aestuarii TaxID=2998507 RepID=A0A9X3F7C6_9BACT|nr:response regulator [Prolixibacteraceae bacterium Z1-6]